MEIIIGLVSGGLAAAVAALAVKIKRINPVLNETLEMVEKYRNSAATILGLVENIELILKALSAAVEDEKLDDNEVQALIADARVLLSNPAVEELKKLVDGD
jgi:20S proteasome alpha/beta subunit